MSDRRFRVDPRDVTPVDPWATVTEEPTASLPPELRALSMVEEWSQTERQRPRNRQIYGRVYELITGDPQDGPHPYVGKTRQTLHQRVHSSRNAHTSPESIAKDPWKVRILPGRNGYRLLETVYATGDDAADERELRRVENFWMDRLRTTHNEVRPVRPPLHEQQPVRRVKSAPRRALVTPAQRGVRRRLKAYAVLVVACITFYAVQFAGVAWTEPATPWIAAPVCGTLTASAIYFGARRIVRRIKRRW